MWDAAILVLRAKFIAPNAYIRTQNKFQINNLSFHLKILKEGKQNKPKAIRRQEIIKIRAEVSNIENKQKK